MKKKLLSSLITIVLIMSFAFSTMMGAYGAELTAPCLTVKSYATKVSLSWTKDKNADGYEVYWCGGETTSVPHNKWDYGCWNDMVRLVTIKGNSTTSYTKTGLSYDKNYHFIVRSYKNSGSQIVYSGWSDTGVAIDSVNRLNAATLKPKNTYKIINTQGRKNTVSEHTLTAEEKKILADFAAKHFTADMTAGDKVCYTAEWIRNHLEYGPIPTYSHTKNIFVKKQGQCSDYNGAMVEMMIYLGFDARLIQGYRNGSTQHFWGEVIIDGSVFLMEVGEKVWDGGGYKWCFYCNTYSEADGGYYKNGSPAKDSIAKYPDKVADLKVASKTDSVINLSWSSVKKADGYYIYKYNCSQGKFVKVDTVSADTNTYRFSSLKAGTLYKFAIKTFKIANGQTITSTSYSQLTAKTLPGAVTGFKVAGVNANAVKLSWDAVKSATGYIIYKYDTSKKTWVKVEITKTTDTVYTVKNLSSGKKYDFAIKAYRTEDGKTVSSRTYPEISAVTKLPKVQGVVITTSDNNVKLTWDKVSGAKDYYVYRYVKNKWTKIATTENITYTVKNIGAGKSCLFTVKAHKKVSGLDVASVSYDTFKTTTKPATVNFTLTAGTGKAVVKWSAVNGATGYHVYYKTSANASWQKLADTTKTSFTKTGLVKGKKYYFTVKAYKKYNGSVYNGKYVEKAVVIK